MYSFAFESRRFKEGYLMYMGGPLLIMEQEGDVAVKHG
jgi:hypothetical protein